MLWGLMGVFFLTLAVIFAVRDMKRETKNGAGGLTQTDVAGAESASSAEDTSAAL